MKTIKKILVISLLGIQVTSSCTTSTKEKEVEQNETRKLIASQVSLSDEQVSAIELTTVKLELKSMDEVVKANGFIDIPPSNRALVSPKAPGFVKNTWVLEGTEVKKGQTLAVLENQEYIILQQEYLELKHKLVLLESEFERQKLLNADKINAKKNLIEAEFNYKAAKSKFEGLKKQIQMLNITFNSLEAGNIASEIPIISPISGFITKSDFALGQFVNSADVMFEIVNTEHVHAELHVFEKDITKIKEGQIVRFTISNNTNHEYTGRVYLVGKSFDQEKKVVRIHVHLDEEDKNLVPGLYVDGIIVTGSRKVFSLPHNAIVHEGGKEYIFISSNDSTHSYQKLEITTGNETKNQVEVILPKEMEIKDITVVSHGAHFLLTENNQE